MGPFEPTPEERQAALIQALKSRMGQQEPQAPNPADFNRAWGNLGLQTGDRVLSQFGKSQVDQAQQMDTNTDQMRRFGLTQTLEAQRAASTEKHQRTQEELQRQALGQGRWSLSAPAGGQPYKIDGRTGEVIPVGVAPEPKGSASLDQKAWKEFSDSISTVTGRANLNRENQARLYSSERLKALAQIPNPSPQQLQEIAMASAQLAGGSAPTEHAIQAMLPKGMGLRAADLGEWLTNEPQGAGQQAFVKMMLDQANREERVIHDQMIRGQTQRLPIYAHLRAKDREQFDAALTAAGIDPALIDDRGQLATKAPGLSSESHPAGSGDFSLEGDTVMVLPPGGSAPVPVHRANLQEALRRGGKVVPNGG